MATAALGMVEKRQAVASAGCLTSNDQGLISRMYIYLDPDYTTSTRSVFIGSALSHAGSGRALRCAVARDHNNIISRGVQMRLKDKVCLITGTGGSIGRAAACASRKKALWLSVATPPYRARRKPSIQFEPRAAR